VNADQYLLSLVRRETVDTGQSSPVRGVIGVLRPALVKWGNNYLAGIAPSGSFAKSTAIRSGTDIDLFLSLRAETPDNLRDIYKTLFNAMQQAGYTPKKQNVSINIKVGAYDVDLVPAQRQDNVSSDHSLYRGKKDSWTKTNVQKHIATVRAGGRLLETRLLKLWRNSFVNARVQTLANTNNIISDDLTVAEKSAIKSAATRALGGTWAEFAS
jgi:hypothetical protein